MPNFDPLRYAPPAQSSPTTIDLTGSSGTDYFGAGITTAGADYIIRLSPTVARTGMLEIDAGGARSIHIIGGKWALNDGGTKNYHIHIQNLAGWAFIEGQEADMTSTHADFLCVSGGSTFTPTLYFQNSRILNLTADDSTNHADIVQPQGKLAYLYVDKLTFSSNYQGFTIASDGSTGNVPLRGAYLSRVNAWYSAANAVTPNSSFLWLNNGGGGANDTLPFPLVLNNFWVDIVRGNGRASFGGNINFTCFPNQNSNSATGNTSAFTAGEHIGAADGGQGGHQYATYPDPKMLVSGRVTKGSPPVDGISVLTDIDGLGSYVPAGIGTNYASPGYQVEMHNLCAPILEFGGAPRFVRTGSMG